MQKKICGHPRSRIPLPQRLAPPGLGNGGPGSGDIFGRHENPQRKGGDPRLDGRDVPVGDEDGDPLAREERFHGADENRIGRADDFFQDVLRFAACDFS